MIISPPKDEFGYLASPYGHAELAMMHYRFVKVCEVAAILLKEGYKFYCPIAHTHPIADYGKLPLVDHDIWLPFDEPMMEKSDALWIVCMTGWGTSKGVHYERSKFVKDGKPIRYVCPNTGAFFGDPASAGLYEWPVE